MSAFPVTDFLETLRGRQVFFDPLHGNHGDRLLLLAAQALLEKAPFTLALTPESADFILLNGGGSMVHGWFGLERLANYSYRFPSHPLAVLPSSFNLSRSELAEITRERQSPLWLWAREQASLAILEDAVLDMSSALGRSTPGESIIGLDHDLAFSLDQHPLIRQLENTPVEDIVLIVERDDWEGPTGRRRPFSQPGLDFIPEKIRTAVRKTLLGPLRKKQDRTSPFQDATLRFISQKHPEMTGLVPMVADISLEETCIFEDFLSHIARAALIVTTRLHVAILGHLLKRTTYLVEGSYHKFRGVFDYSMQQGSTRLLTWNGQELELHKNYQGKITKGK